MRPVRLGSPLSRRHVAVVIALLTLCLAQSAIGQSPHRPQVADPTSYEVYAAALRLQTAGEATSLLIREETVALDTCASLDFPTSTEWREALLDYQRQNAHGWQLKAGMNLRIPYRFLSTADADRIAAARFGWLRFWIRQWFEGHFDTAGFYQVSAVGFDRSQTRAMLQVDYLCGGLCGGGQRFLLERRDGRWQECPEADLCMWQR